jgi:trimeric autotransporter adhesin
MRKIILMSVVGMVFLGACQKKAENNPSPIAPGTPVIPPTTQTVAAQTDTIPDGGMLKIKLQLDSATIDETLLSFKHSASCNFSNSDAPYFPGFGRGSLSSVTRDGISCAIQTIPFTHGIDVPLKVSTKNDGVYLLKTSFTKNIPANVGIWLKDAYRKDSLNIRIWNYRFDVIKSDTNTYAHRFSVVMR